MNIRTEAKARTVQFVVIAPGQVFKSEFGDICMRLYGEALDADGNFVGNAVDLTNGDFYLIFQDDDEVYPLNVELVVR